jgi:hypothetical protein
LKENVFSQKLIPSSLHFLMSIAAFCMGRKSFERTEELHFFARVIKDRESGDNGAPLSRCVTAGKKNRIGCFLSRKSTIDLMKKKSDGFF